MGTLKALLDCVYSIPLKQRQRRQQRGGGKEKARSEAIVGEDRVTICGI